jgi:hypothetical protein
MVGNLGASAAALGRSQAIRGALGDQFDQSRLANAARAPKGG